MPNFPVTKGKTKTQHAFQIWVGLGLGIFMDIFGGLFTKKVNIFRQDFSMKLVIDFVESEWVCMNTIIDRA